MNVEQARLNMVEQQIRTWDVLDHRVLEVIASTPREDFVPERYGALAFADVQIPLDHGEVMMQPKLEGRLLQALALHPTDSVLEIGTGSGFLTACLARLSRHVHSVEIHAELKYAAQKKLAAHGIGNVSLRIGDASQGWGLEAPYDAIAVTGSLPVLPPAFEQSLAVGGRLFVIVGESPAMEALLITRVGEDEWTRQSLFETVVPPLLNAARPPRFVL